MATKEKSIRVFISSPSDVAGERQYVVDAIEEINTTWSSTLKARLTPFRWERDCRPGVGSDAQSVINGQSPNDYDILVGILWQRFGTPTPRFGSGTEEEFERALAFRKKRRAMSILIYFKDAPIIPSKTDTHQLERVKKFKLTLSPKGVLYWDFKSKEQFRQLMRIHLSKELQKRINIPISKKPSADLLRLKKQSTIQSTSLFSVIGHHYTVLAAHESQLSEITSKKYRHPSEILLNYVGAANWLCSQLEPTLTLFSKCVSGTVDAWVNEFMARVFTKKVNSKTTHSFLKRLTDLSEVFEKQARQYGEHSDSTKKYPLFSREFSAVEKRQRKLFKAFSEELELASKIFDEAIVVVQLLARRKGN